MSRRAFIVVLDAVGAGELPDAAAWGDEGSSTLAHVAEAVGGLRLPNLQALGLGNVLPLEGCPPLAIGALRRRPPARALAGQGHHGRPLGARRDRHRAPVPDLPARLPAGGPRRVRGGDGSRRDRQRGGVGHRDHRAAGGRAPAHREVDRLHLGRLGLPGRRARGDGAARGAVRGLPHRARAADGRARRGPRDRAPVRGRGGRLSPHGQPPRFLARAAAAQLPHAHPRGREARHGRRQDRRRLRRLRHRRLAADALQRRRGSPARSRSHARAATASCS